MSETTDNEPVSGVRRGYERSTNALVGAMIAVALLAVLGFALNQLLQRDRSYPPQTVDYAPQLTAARADAPFAVLAPEPVPPDWRATSVDAGRQDGEYVWHLGFVVDEAEYAAVDQTTGDPDDFLGEVTPATEQDAPVQVNGVRWQTLSEPGGDDEALVLSRGDSTTVVSGTLPRDVLVAFAESLQSH